MKIKISERATHAHNELLLQNVSARVWQNLVAFSSVFLFIKRPVCGRQRPFQDCTERPAAAVVGSNGLIIFRTCFCCPAMSVKVCTSNSFVLCSL